VDPDENRRLVTRSRTVEKRPENGYEATVEFNSDEYTKKFAERVILAWEGLNEDALKLLIPGFDTSELGLEPEECILFDSDEAFWLMQKSTKFSTWVNELSTQLESFNKAKTELELKNSGTGSSGSGEQSPSAVPSQE
jgi:hypothetical protein